MIDKIPIAGVVAVTIKKPDGTIVHAGERQNTINLELKKKCAEGMGSAIANVGIQESAFDDDEFTSPTVGGSGIVIYAGTSYYEMDTISVANSSSGVGFTIVSRIRASANYTITKAYLGNSWNGTSNKFDTDYSDVTTNISLSNGYQLDLTWTVRIADA